MMFIKLNCKYNFQQQMHRNTSQIIDIVSTKDLMKALTTLQQLSKKQQQTQISFCRFDHTESSKRINFQAYMAGQNTNYSRKSNSTLKQKHIDNGNPKVSNMKSRSHSPLEKRSDRNESRVTNYSKYTGHHTEKQNNKKQEMNRKKSQYPSQQSKKILQQMHKSGVNYVPIQHRAEYLLKQKQMKLAQLKKQKQITKIIEEKQCTFRPSIIKNYKKPNHIQKQDRNQRITQAEMSKFDQCFIDQDFLCAPTQPLVRQTSMNSQQEMANRNKVQVNQNDETKIVRKKYKNQKFNPLLDLIH